MTERICNQSRYKAHSGTGKRRTAIVVIITALTMAAEIVYGMLTGSMALLADGIHMGTHTFALLIALIAYYLSERHEKNGNFTFSTGKIGILGGYTNAILLGVTALYMVYEAIHRLLNPETIFFNQALIVAGIGLSVNLLSALLLSVRGQHEEHHHSHGHHQDHNLRAAYLHVLTDALTSILAILALLIGKYFNQTWPDSIVAILGAVVILKWAYGLLISSGKLLVDNYNSEEEKDKIKKILEPFDSELTDLHIWNTSENLKAIIISARLKNVQNRNTILEQLKTEFSESHLTLDIECI